MWRTLKTAEPQHRCPVAEFCSPLPDSCCLLSQCLQRQLIIVLTTYPTLTCLQSTCPALLATVSKDAGPSKLHIHDLSDFSSLWVYVETGTSHTSQHPAVCLAGPSLLAPISKDAGPSKLHIEHCFALPTSSTSSSERFRIKVVQQFRKNWSNGAWILDAVDLHKER